jgi:hypothetical protein
MTTETNRYETTSDADLWAILVGDQTPDEFMSDCDGPDARRTALLDYVYGADNGQPPADTCEDLNETEADAAFGGLRQYVIADGYHVAPALY